ncbi:MAG: lecithin retinol acyltransferase family protein [Synechococcales cyanobacterium M58_A2018_015]|nr:lecithin retinol acyltransferase family protein [Synechococcales cyanobacterium M58_A2018_015]
MARGDQIYVMRPLINLEGVYEHHGIDCGDGTVIHYHKGEDAVICRTSMEAFARGNPVYVKRYPVSYLPDVVVERAESRLGERRYNLLTNNCEHFATWCKTGNSESQQLIEYGLGLGAISPTDSQRMVEEIAEGGNPVKAMELFNQAISSAAAAEAQLQTQYQRLQGEIESWHRVAQVALQKGREDLARAALERKVAAKRQLEQVQGQLDQILELHRSIQRNQQVLQQRVTTEPIAASYPTIYP